MDLQQTDTAPFCVIAQVLAEVGGTPGTVEFPLNVSGSSTQTKSTYDCLIAAGASWNAGTWTVRINVTASNMNLTLQEVIIERWNSSCVSQGNIGSATGLGISLGSTGVKTVQVTGSAQTPNAGDRVMVRLTIQNGNMNVQTVGITPSEIITSPFTAAATYTYSGSGGVALGGAAALAKTKVFAASGGLLSGGVAATEYAPPSTVYTYSASGGATLGGAAALAKTKDYLTSGGATLGGAAALAKTKDYLASGGATLGGAAALAKVKGYLPSGGLVLAGAAALAKAKDYLPSGGFTIAGDGSVNVTKAYAASGGLLSGGAAATVYEAFGTAVYTYSATGGMALGGAAATAYESGAVQPSEQVVFAGGNWPSFAPQRRRQLVPVVHEYTASGGAVFGGAAAIERTVSRSYKGQGNVRLITGEADSYRVRSKRVREEEYEQLLRKVA